MPRVLLHVYVFRRGGHHGGRGGHSGGQHGGGRHGGRRRKLQASNGGSLEKRLPTATITASAVGLQNCPAFFPRMLPGPHWAGGQIHFLIPRFAYIAVCLIPRFAYIAVYLCPDLLISRFTYAPICLYRGLLMPRFAYIAVYLCPDFPYDTNEEPIGLVPS